MALDFYNIEDVRRSSLLLSISEYEMNNIEKIFDGFNLKFGNYFDQYRDTRLYKNHIIELKEIAKSISPRERTSDILIDFLEDCLKSDVSLLIICD